MRRYRLTVIAPIPLSACDGGDLPAAYRDLTVPEARLASSDALCRGRALYLTNCDATAAFANPAGLVQLVEPEVSIEGRAWSYSTPHVERGRFEGQPTGLGIDVEPGIRVARSGGR